MDDLATLTLSNTSSKMRSLPTLPNSIYKITEGPKSEVQTMLDFAHMFTYIVSWEEIELFACNLLQLYSLFIN